MRITITVDDDVAARLKARVKNSSHQSFNDVVNETLRFGLLARPEPSSTVGFTIRSRLMGVRQGLNCDNIGALLEQIEGVEK